MIDQKILNLLKDNKRIGILPHIIPDGDTIGSACALQYALKSLGKEVFIIIEDDIPSNLEFINIESLIDFRLIDDESMNFDLIITMDSSDIDRLGKRIKLFDYTDDVLNIDHHKTNTNYGSYNIIDSTASACGEIIYRIIKALNININKAIATYIYVALTTDTGSFKYSNTTSTTLRIAAELLEAGIDRDYINIQLYQNNSLNKVNLLSESLSTLELYYNHRISTMYISIDMLKKSNVNTSNVDGLIEYARDIKDVEVAILFKEFDNKELKIGLRSKGNCDVSKIAKLFGGGGHKNAAGCIFNGTIDNAKKKFVELFIAELEVKT